MAGPVMQAPINVMQNGPSTSGFGGGAARSFPAPSVSSSADDGGGPEFAVPNNPQAFLHRPAYR